MGLEMKQGRVRAEWGGDGEGRRSDQAWEGLGLAAVAHANPESLLGPDSLFLSNRDLCQ